jgi:DNA-binding NtrC family response regulator
MFRRGEVVLRFAVDAETAIPILEVEGIDMLVTDVMMPGMNGLKLIERVKAMKPELPCIAITGNGNVAEAVRAIKLGATDYLEKPVEKELLLARILQAARIADLTRENRILRSSLEPDSFYEPLVGISGTMLELKRLIARISPTDVHVLIQGETGTGKELVARAVHHHSLRCETPFVVVDCASLSETLAESELFGYVKGAYTGADSSQRGLVRTAEGGTLFLDEIGELSPTLQTRFLRMLQEKTVRPVGSATNYGIDVRIVAATNRDLMKEVGSGNFREDLFYRLNVVSLSVPPLRDRRDDIAHLARHFIENHDIGMSPVSGVDESIVPVLEQYHWPGNVRELQNAMTRAIALGTDRLVRLADLPLHILEHGASPTPSSRFLSRSTPKTMHDYEELAIRTALEEAGGDKPKAAETLGIGLATLYRKLKELPDGEFDAG